MPPETMLHLPDPVRQALRQLAQESQFLLFGELHGTQEPPQLIATLLDDLTSLGYGALALEIRRRWPHDDLFILGYSNGAVSYLPDAYDIDRGSYASLQVPRAVRACPFTRDAGMVAVAEVVATLEALAQ